MRNIHGDTHAGKVEPVAQEDKSQSDYVVQDEFLEILSRLFQLQYENDCLLSPVAGFKKIECLEDTYVFTMGEPFKHGSGAKVPEICLLHDV